jgi:hypothetical protein
MFLFATNQLPSLMKSSFVVLTDFFAVFNRALAYAAALAVPMHAHLVLLPAED